MSLRTAWMAMLLMPLLACSGDDKGETDSGGGDDGGSGEVDDPLWDGEKCPDEVPDGYEDLWSCRSGCGGDEVMYHQAVGESFEDGSFAVTESFFFFDPSREESDEEPLETHEMDWCFDTFEITGTPSEYTVDTFNCTTCETIYDVKWDMTTDNQCLLLWGSLFFGKDYRDKEPPYNGVILMDTHNSFGDRNPDDAMIVYGYPIAGSNYYDVHNGDYGRGTATPTSETDGPPEAYEWASGSVCFD